jgi:SAM-dependent methyltransferase
MHKNSYDLFARVAGPLFRPGVVSAEHGSDVPGGPYSLEDYVLRAGSQYYCLESDPSGQFDVVFAANVIEHIPAPWRWLDVVYSRIKLGGHLVLVAPVSWPYHPAPKDCWRVYPDGMRALLEDAGLTVTACELGTADRVEDAWLHEHGPGPVVDCIGVGRKSD